MKNKQYAFWKYDQFPYILGAEVEEMLDDGRVKPKGYGGYVFRPVAIMSLKEGIEFQNKLNSIKAEREVVLNSIKNLFIYRLKSIAPFVKQLSQNKTLC